MLLYQKDHERSLLGTLRVVRTLMFREWLVSDRYSCTNVVTRAKSSCMCFPYEASKDVLSAIRVELIMQL